MRVAYIQRDGSERDHIISKIGDMADLYFYKSLEDITHDEASEVEIISLFFKRYLGQKELAKFPSLKMIAIRSTGFDNLDLKACKERGITVTNVPDYGERTVAEYAFALILSVSRKICRSNRAVRETGRFSRENLRGFDLYGKRLGVIGTGHIGMNVIRIAKGFGMEVVAFDPFPKPEEAGLIGFEYRDFDTVLGESDILTLHAPYNRHTHHMINYESIARFKDGVFLINVSRGGLIETGALIKALESGKVAGAALDVLEEEDSIGSKKELFEDPHPRAEILQKLLADQYLINHPNVIVTPHNAFNTKEAFERIQDSTVLNIISFIKGQPINTVI